MIDMSLISSKMLLLRPKPKVGESFLGYILRLTEVNNYESPKWIAFLGGLELQLGKAAPFVFKTPAGLAIFSRLVGLSQCEVVPLTYAPSESPSTVGDHLFFGLPVSKYFIRAVRPKICPECLRESNYCRRIWDLAAVTTCPAHKVILTDQCPKCNRQINWVRGGVSVCLCKFDWREIVSTLVEEQELKLTHHIHQLCEPTSTLKSETVQSNDNPLYDLALGDLLSALFFIAGQYENVMDVRGKYTAPTRRNSEVHTLLSKALVTFESWPDKFFEFLHWQQEHGSKSRRAIENSRTGLHKHFGIFYEGLYRYFAASQFDFMRHAFSKYLSKHWRGGYWVGHLNRHKVGVPYAENKKYVGKTEAIRHLKISEEGFFYYMTIGKLKTIVGSRGKTNMYLVDVDSLEGLKREFNQTLSAREAADRLGIGLPVLRELVQHGLLNLVRGPTVDGSKRLRFSQEAIEELLDKLMSRVTHQPSEPIGCQMSFQAALKRIYRTRTVVLLEAIISGEVSPSGEGSGIGFSRLQFNEADIEKYSQSRDRLMRIAA